VPGAIRKANVSEEKTRAVKKDWRFVLLEIEVSIRIDKELKMKMKTFLNVIRVDN